MHLAHNILLGFLALVFLISGASKISGTPKGLSGTRDVGIKDWLARAIGLVEAIAALGLIYGIRYTGSFIGWVATVILWCAMGTAIWAHTRVNKLKTAFPAGFLLVLLTVVLVFA
jgi:uncharacterized membrane protein